MIGGSEAGWGAWIKALGDQGITLVNFSFNPMTRLPYTPAEDIPPGNLPKGLAIQIDETVSDQAPITLIQPKLYAERTWSSGFEWKEEMSIGTGPDGELLPGSHSSDSRWPTQHPEHRSRDSTPCGIGEQPISAKV